MTTASPTAPADATPAAAATSPGTTSPAAPAPTTSGTSQAAASGTDTPAPPDPPPAEPARVVPAEYTLTIPEGYDADDAQAVAALAKEHQWTNEEAQAALDASHGYVQKERDRIHARLQADPEVGGEHLAQAQQAALRVLDRFLPATEPAGAEFRKFLNKTGYGNAPELVRLLSRIGHAMGEDSIVARDKTQSPAVDPLKLFYGGKGS
jgi:hypothetical protein